MFRHLKKLFTSNQTYLPGRWKLRHNPDEVERFIQNYYGEPGYPNQLKNTWIKNLTNLQQKKHRN